MDNENQNMNSTAQPPAQGGLPQSMRFAVGSKRSVAARMQHLNFQPFNGNSFSPDSNNEIRIQVQGSGFIDVSKHLLRLTVTAVTAGTNAATIDYSLASIFDQIRIESQGTVLERIDRYGLIDNVKSMYNDSAAEIKNKSALTLGPDITQTAIISAGKAFGANAGTGGSVTGGLRIRSGLLQSKHGHALPMGSAPLEIILRLNSLEGCLLGLTGATPGTITSLSVSNVAFLCPMYQIESEQIMAQYRQVLTSSPLTICGTSYKTYVNSLVSGGTNQVLQINDKSRSLKGLVTLIRAAAAPTTFILPSNSEFSVANVNRYTYMVGGAQMPPGGIALSSTNCAEAMDQAQRSLAPYNEIRGFGLVGFTKFTAAVGTTGAGGKGVLAVDLRKFSDSERCFVGLDTASSAQPMTLELECASGIAASDVTTFAVVEAEYVLSQGRWGVSV
jgi:hypothetical protein